MSQQTFPDVYASVVDKSNFTTTNSRFRVGLLGPAEKGPINSVITVQSLDDFTSQCGASIPGTYLANAVQLVSPFTNNVSVVRVASQYQVITGSGASRAAGNAGALAISAPNAGYFSAGQYVRVTELFKQSTVNAKVISSIGTTVTIGKMIGSTLVGTVLADSYDAANIDSSNIQNAANEAEAFLYSPTWNANAVGATSGTTGGMQVANNGTNPHSVIVVADPHNGLATIVSGNLYKISQGTGFADTLEIMVDSVVPAVAGNPAVINFKTSSLTDRGYVNVPLSDQYSAAFMYAVTGYTLTGHMLASSPGGWANSDGVSTGLIVNVSPGTVPGTKKLTSYEDSVVVEIIDNLTFTPTLASGAADPNYIMTRVNGESQYIVLNQVPSNVNEFNDGPLQLKPFANTRNPWSPAFSNVVLNIAAFNNGYNGEFAQPADYVGAVDPVTQLPTGLKCLEDITQNLQLNCICCPGATDGYLAGIAPTYEWPQGSGLIVSMEIDRINRLINAEGIIDVPYGLTSAQAVAWTNGTALYNGMGSLDTYTLAYVWNWGQIVDATTGEYAWVPPSVGALRAIGYTFTAFKPWQAPAGEIKGVIPEFVNVQFPRLSDDQRQALYGNGNVVNPIIVNRNRIMLWGNLTTQRTASKLTALGNCFLVQYVVTNLARLGRKYLWQPITSSLENQVQLEFLAFMRQVYNDQGIDSSYNVDCSSDNNTASDENQRQMNVEVDFIPTDALERMFISCTVNQSGAILNNVS